VQQKRSKRGLRGRRSRIRAGWYTLNAALAALGWPWLRLLIELSAGRLAFRTHPAGHEHEIDWSDDTLRVDLAASTMCTWETDTVAVEVWLPVGQRPPVAVRRPWQPKLSPEEIKGAVEKIAQAHPPPNWLPFHEFWAKLRAQLGPKVTKRVATNALKYAPHLRGKRGQKRKMKSSS
jgi:hypothetical protein